jgi:hypothetical protein
VKKSAPVPPWPSGISTPVSSSFEEPLDEQRVDRLRPVHLQDLRRELRGGELAHRLLERALLLGEAGEGGAGVGQEGHEQSYRAASVTAHSS